MKLKLIFIFLIFILFKTSYSQNVQIKGKVIDLNSNQSIAAVNIYAIGTTQVGTISNNDGDFVLNIKKDVDTLIFSHINYKNKILTIDNTNHYLNIKLIKETHNLGEVIVRPIKAEDIIKEAISKLKYNHSVEPVYYDFYTRIINFSKIDSNLNLLAEHTGLVLQKENHNSELNLDKSRFGYFSKEGKKMYKDYRMISMSKMSGDNLFWLSSVDDYIHKRKYKNYTYKYLGEEIIMDRTCHVISFYTAKKTYYKKGKLYIDKESYGIVKKVLEGNDGYIDEEKTFKQINGKWYLKNVNDLHGMENNFEQRITLYNLIPEAEVKTEVKAGFIRAGELLPEKVKKLTGDFNDKYWEENNFIPLPNWIKERIEQWQSR